MIIGRSRSAATVVAPRAGVVAALAVVAGLIAPTGPATADGATGGPASVLYERTLVLAADRSCRLFSPDIRTALEAATLQARGAAARAGVGDEDLNRVRGEAMAAGSAVDCANPDLLLVQGRIVSAYSAWAGMRRMEFPGDRADWNADRTRFQTVGWRLTQNARMAGAEASFGLTAEADGRTAAQAVVSFVGRSRPYAARLVFRDNDRLTHPVLAGKGVAGAALPPPEARRAVFAGRSAEAPEGLLAAGREQGEIWTFPQDVIQALGRLDPREPFVIEFLFRDDSVARARFEAGDLAAGAAFVGMGAV